MNNQIINKFQGEIDEIGQRLEKSLSSDCLKLWNEQKSQIDRTFKQFENEQHFIIATGMLKAGKSTLIDLLARSTEASLVGFGIDTTLRPALIKMSDSTQGRIKIYYPKEGKSKKEAMQAIVDELRGLAPLFRIEPRECPLDQQHLREVLCLSVAESRELSDEPVLVIVEIPQNQDSQFFRNNCVLLDMPGLDSGFSEQSKDESIYKAFFDESDLLLFIQSSVAPINGKAGEYLMDIGSSRNISTYKLIQNVMNAKYWLKSSVTDKEQSQQAENGLKVFLDKIGQKNQKIHPCYVNLGMAYDALLGQESEIDAKPECLKAKKKELLAQSHYLEMENNFINDIKNNGKHRRLQHCCDTLANRLRESLEAIAGKLAGIERMLAEKRESQASCSKKIRRMREKCEQYNFPPIQFGLCKEFLSTFSKGLINEFESIRNSADYKDELELNGNDENVEKMIKCKATVLEKFLGKCASKGAGLAIKLLSDSFLDALVHTEGGKEKTAIEFAQKELKKIAESLAEDGISLNGDKISANTNKIGEIDKTMAINEYQAGQFEITKFFGFLWETKGTNFNKTKTFNDMAMHYKNQIEGLVNTNSFAVNKITQLIRSQAKEDLEPQIKDAQHEMDYLDSQIKSLENDKRGLKDAKQKLEDLERNVPKAKDLDN